MKIDSVIIKFLKGEDLSTGLSIPISREKYPKILRESRIVDLIRNKRVIHVGCSDHIQVINDKLTKNIWLHKLITDNARDCIGIDIDRKSIEFIRNELGFENVYYGDILSDTITQITAKQWDCVVFGEIIEHLDNPVHFLKTFKEKYADYVSHFIITVPNIYNRQHYRNMLRYTENINTDHRFSFTPYTINKVIFSAGYESEKIFYANLIKLSFTELVVRKLKNIIHLPVRYPYYYFNSIIVSGSIKR